MRLVSQRKLNTPVYGIALGITLSRAATGPFAQFQNSDDSEESLTKLVMQLVGRIPNSEPDRDAIAMQVRTFKERANSVLKKIETPIQEEPEESVDETSVAKLFEEVKVMFQDLPSRIEGQLDPMRHRRKRRIHPAMIEEFFHMSKSDEPIFLLSVIGLLREDMPWLYELGLELYRAIQSGSVTQIKKTGEAFHLALDFTARAPFARELHDKESFYFMREASDVLHHYVERSIEQAVEKAANRKAATKRRKQS